jgi:hypothetical protein
MATFSKGEISVSIEEGEAWLHRFPLFLGFKMKNPPQIAIWIEDMEGKYLDTIYVSRKAATQSWLMAGGHRRPEALPHWCHQRGVKYEDGLYMPTKKQPLADALTGATPQGSFEITRQLLPAFPEKFIVKVEINHSADYNEAYPKTARPGEAHYSAAGGQPALVYAARIALASGASSFEAGLLGHSSPDGSNGRIEADLSGITTALHIVKRITVACR